MGNVYTNSQVLAIEQDIERLISEAKLLDDDNPHESLMLDDIEAKLAAHAANLERSLRNLRIRRIGLRLVS